jgi:response regulator RpfG family c-di-GMP phosphodiesterase
MQDKIKFIIVENEGTQLSTIQKVVERIYSNSPVHIATNAQKAIEIIEKNGENSVIISSLKLPDLNGLKLLEKVKEFKLINYLFILALTPEAESVKVQALRDGVSDFITKPYIVEELIPKVRNSYILIESFIKVNQFEKRYFDLKESFDREILKIKDILDLIISKKIPDSTEELILIEKATKWLCDKLLTKREEAEEVITIVNASKLVKTGRVILDDKTINEPIMTDGRLTSQDMKLIPDTNFQIYSQIRGFEKVAFLLKYIYENFDGTGFPEGKKSWEIPFGSRILRVVCDYYDILKKEKNSGKAMDKIVFEVKRLYDFNVVAYFDQFLAETNTEGTKQEIPTEIFQLTEGVTISRNILTKEGFVLLGRNTVLDLETLQKLKLANQKEGIVGNVYIYDIGTKEERSST